MSSFHELDFTFYCYCIDLESIWKDKGEYMRSSEIHILFFPWVELKQGEAATHKTTKYLTK